MSSKDLYESDEYRSNAQKVASDAKWTWWKILLPLVLTLIVGGTVIAYIAGAIGAGNEAANVARQEFGAKAMLAKYEWFKDASTQLEAKTANVKVFQRRIQDLKGTYSGKSHTDWAREDREQYNLYVQETDGITASYNTLAAEYNAQMAKFNWRFANVGTLPSGASAPLPREYKPYVTQ